MYALLSMLFLAGCSESAREEIRETFNEAYESSLEKTLSRHSWGPVSGRAELRGMLIYVRV